jgi:CHAT domain-containing protein/Tfp pilus assembly protein PilF
MQNSFALFRKIKSELNLARSVVKSAGIVIQVGLVICLLLLAAYPAGAQPATQDSQPSKSHTSAPQKQKEELRPLKKKQPPVVSQLSGGEVHNYILDLKADQFMSLVVDQNGIDVVLSLFGPDGKLLRTVDGLSGSKGEEWLSWIGEIKGKYRLEVSSLEKTAKSGSYTVKDVEIRSSAPRDRKYVTADMAFVEADAVMAKEAGETSREALAKYEAVRPLWHELGEKIWEAATLSRIGRMYSLLGEPAKALEPLNAAVPLWRASGDHLSEALTLSRLGRVHTALKDHVKALESNKQALQICRELKQCDSEAVFLEYVAAGYEATGDKQKALDTYKEAETIYAKAGNRPDQARTLIWIGDLQRDLNDPKDAVDVYARVVAIRQDMKDRKGEAVALQRLGHSYAEMGEDRRALEFYERALSMAQAEADQGTIFWVRYSMGQAYQRLNEQPKALELFDQILPDASAEVKVRVLTDIARSHRLSGDRQLALDVYKKALSLIPAPKSDFEKLMRSEPEGEVLIPEIESELKKLKELETLEGEARRARGANDRAGELAALNRIGVLKLELRDVQPALEAFNRALSLLQALGDRSGQAEALNKIGLLYLAAQYKQKALDNLAQSLKLYREVGDGRAGQEMLSVVNLVNGSLRGLPGGRQSERMFEQEAVDAYGSLGDSRPAAAHVANLELELWIANRHLDALLLQNVLLKEALAVRSNPTGAKTDTGARLATLYGYFDVYAKEGKWQDAIKKGNELLALRPELKYKGPSYFYAFTLHRLGDIYVALDDRGRALDLYIQALAVWRELRNRPSEIDRALRNLQKPLEEADTLVAMGFTYNWLGNRVKALEVYEEALKLQGPGNDALTLYRIGESHFLIGERQKALEVFNRALAERMGLKNDQLAGQITEYIGRVYASLGQLQKEQDYYKLSLKESKRSLAVVLEGRKSLVGKYLAESSRDKQDYGLWDRSRQSAALSAIGEAYYRLGMKTEALATFNEALPILKDTGRRTGEAQVLLKVGLLYLSSGERSKALEALEEALTLRRADGNLGRQAEILHIIGTVYDSSGDKQKALEFYTQALSLWRDVKDPEGEGETLDKLMSLWKGLDKPQLAIFYGKQAVNAFQRIRSNIAGLDKALQKGFLASRSDTYRQLADLLISAGRLPEAQQVLDVLKQEEFLDFVRSESDPTANGGATLNGSEAALLQRYSEIEGQVIAIARQSGELRSKESLTAEDKTLLDKLEKDLEAANFAFDKFLAQLPSEFKDAVQGSGKALELRSAQALSETLRELGPGVVALYTVTSPEKYHVIVITADTQVAREYSINVADLNRKVQQFRTVLQNPKFDPLPLAQELYKILVGPIAKDLEDAKATTLMWSLDGTLRYLPMAALHDGRQYMVEKYQNTVFTPASQSRLEKPANRKWRGLGLGVSKSAIPLPFVVDELHGIIHDDTDKASTDGVLAGRIMLDDTFTKDGMKEALRRGKGFSLVHIASHFVFKPGNETDSYLLLGGQAAATDEDKHLTMAEVQRAPNLFSGVELLTLSACNTGVGNSAAGAGAEVENFGVLAQLKGARAVIATLWRVNDKSTMRLMRTFYQLHNDRPEGTKAGALQQAQLALLRGQIVTTPGEPARGGEVTAGEPSGETLPLFKVDQQAPYAHPYYWAPFILIGNWR